MDASAPATFVAALTLAGVQLLPRLLPKSDDLPRWRWLSAAGGFAVAFVFLHMLPELEAAGDPVGEALGHLLPFADNEAHILALVGLIALYGLERLARRPGPEGVEERTTVSLNIGAFSVYYAIVGVLLWNRAANGPTELATYTAAMALHFLVIDHALEARHLRLYRVRGQLALAGGVLAGWAAGGVLPLTDQVIGVLLAFLSGGVILVSLTEEVPRVPAEGRFGWFVGGAAAYTALLFAV